MSFLHPEEARKCQRCGHRWRAERWTKLDAQPPILGVGITARAQDLNRQTVHERRERLHRAWRYCPECNSKKVRTLKGKQADSVGSQQVAAESAKTVSSSPSVADEIEKLAKLRDAGVLSDAEFRTAKSRLLGE